MQSIAIGCTTIIEQQEKILLVQETKPWAFHKWNLPGGHLEIGESLEQAAMREAYEEAGLRIQLMHIVSIVEVPVTLQKNTLLLVTFKAKVIRGTIRTSDEHPQVRFFDKRELAEIIKRKQYPYSWFPRVIKDFRQKKKLPLSTIKYISELHRSK